MAGISILPSDLLGRIVRHLDACDVEQLALTSKLILKQLLRSSRVDAPFTVTRHVLSGISLLDAPSLDAEHDTGIHLALEAMLPQAQEYGPAMTRLIKRMTLFRPGHFLLSEPQVAKIARMCTALRAVDLYDFTVTDYHIEWLANGLGNRLEEIRCGRAKLLGPSAMSALSRCTMLRVLEVHGVTWVSMEDIMQLKALTHLERLVVLADPALSPWQPEAVPAASWAAPARAPLFDERLVDLGPHWQALEHIHINEVNKVHPESMADFLGSLSRLRSLHLTDGDCVTDDVLERLAESCHVLQAVAVTSLHPLPITKRGLACLSRLSALTHLQLQDVGDFEPGDVASAVSSLSDLRLLSINPLRQDPTYARVSFEQFFDAEEHFDVSFASADLPGSSHPPSLRERSLSLSTRTAAALSISLPPRGGALEPLGRLKNLEVLLVRITAPYTMPGESMLTQHRELPPLEEMGSLKAIHLAHWGLLLPTDIARLGSLKDLRHLTLHSCAIDNSALGAISFFRSRAHRLEDLTIYMMSWQPESSALSPFAEPLVSGLAGVAALPRLRRLTVNGSERLTDDSLRAITESETITELAIISCSNITDAGVLSSVMSMTQLRSLTLSSCRVSDMALSGIGRLPNLERLDISQCPLLGDDALRHLANPVTAATLRSLDMSWLISLTDTGMGHLRALQALRVLRARRIRRASSTGLMRLAGTPVRVLDLSDNRDIVTDEVLWHLSPTLRMCVSLDISGCVKVTSKGIAALRMMRNLSRLHGVASLGHEVAVRGLHPPAQSKATGSPSTSATPPKEGSADQPASKRYRASFAEVEPS